jgi:hypothetical protein
MRRNKPCLAQAATYSLQVEAALNALFSYYLLILAVIYLTNLNLVITMSIEIYKTEEAKAKAVEWWRRYKEFPL